MFRKYYKAANDEIKPNRELIDKIFEKSAQEKKKSKVYSFGAKYGTAIAAVLVLCVAVAVYPQIINIGDESQLITQDQQGDNGLLYTTEHKTKESQLQNSDAKSKARIITEAVADIGNDMAKSYEIDINDLKAATDDEVTLATNNLKERLGTVDSSTGNIYIFEIAGKLETEGEEYYLGRWRWQVDGHSSLICEFVLSGDFTRLYDCSIIDNKASWVTENNMFHSAE